VVVAQAALRSFVSIRWLIIFQPLGFGSDGKSRSGNCSISTKTIFRRLSQNGQVSGLC